MTATSIATIRTRRFPLLALLVIAAALVLLPVALVIWPEDDASNRYMLSGADNGATVSVTAGEEIIIHLDSNATTGYEWAVAGLDDTLLRYLGTDYDAPEDGLVGQGGTQELRFEALDPGESTLSLKYWRPFEGDASIAERFSVTVTIVED
jgi:inhibitor of cysteine peptidase